MNDASATQGSSPGAPPPPPEPGAPPPADDASGRFDFSSVLGTAFRDPHALGKFLVGCVAVLLIPFLGLGLFLLLGFGLRTARGVMRGDEHPMPDWGDEFGGILMDGLKAAIVIVVHIVVAVAVGLALLAFGGMLIGFGEADDAPGLMVVGALIGLFSLFLLMMTVLLAKGILPANLMNLAATGSLGSGFAFGDAFDNVRRARGNYFFLLLTLIFIAILGDLSIVLCIVGVIPGMFWQFATFGAAIGQVGRLAGVRVR